MPENPLIDPYSEVNRFLLLAQLGHGPDLLPIVPAGTPISPLSAITDKHLGKIPSLMTDSGAIGLRSWGHINVSHETLEAWHVNLKRYPYGIGLNARGKPAFDIDAKSAEFAQDCFTALEPFYRKYGMGLRIGRPPAWLMPWRCAGEPWRKLRIAVRDHAGVEHAVEMLAQGQYYNLVGLHPRTGQPYRWYPNPHLGGSLVTLHADQFEPAPDAEVAEAWDRLVDALLRRYEPVERSGAARKAAKHDQGDGDPARHLAPSTALVVECLRWLPNDRAHNRTRDEWLSVIRAIATSTGKSPEGLEIACAWSAQWDDSPKAFSDCCAAWESIEPARSTIGFRWLAAKAGDESKGQCRVGIELDFGGDDDDDPPPGPPAPADVPMVQPAPPSFADIEAMIDRLPDRASADLVAPIITAMVEAGLGPLQTDDALKAIKARTKITKQVLADALRAEKFKRVTGGDWDVPRRLAKATLAEFGENKLAWWGGRYMLYEGRYWRAVPLSSVNTVIHRIAASNLPLMTRAGANNAESISTATAQAHQQLQAMIDKRLAPLANLELHARCMVNVQNGTLHYENHGWVLKPHNPDDCFLAVCPFDYDPRAQCPVFDATLRDTMSRSHYTLHRTDPEYSAAEAALERGDPAVERESKYTLHVFDIEDNARMMEEVLGYPLVGWRAPRQFIICKGKGRNGKTKVWEAMQRLLSPDMVHNGRIEAFDKSDFVVSQLAGKLLALTDDAKYEFELNDSIIKMISENKMMTGQIKLQQEPIKFLSTVVPVILTNSWPVTPDISEGMRDRAVIIPFGKKYPRNAENMTPWWAIRHSTDEMTGMLNRLLSGLARVIERGYIEASRASEEAFAEWVNHNAIELQFIEARCTKAQPANQKSDGEKIDTLFGEFRHWYVEQGHGQLRGTKLRKRFRDNLANLGFEIYESNGKGNYRARGLWLRDDVRNAAAAYIEPEGESEDED